MPTAEAFAHSTRVVRVRGYTTLHRFFAIAIIALSFSHNLWIGWHRWGDPIIDCGRELDVPRQLLDGKTLYQDVRYWYGPLAPYTNAVLYRIFGVHSDVIAIAGWITAALAAWLAYRIVRLFAGRSVAVTAAVAILYINAFALYYAANIFNFVLPYSCPATYGTVIALASVYFLLRYVIKPRPIDFFLACLLLSLTALCKLEILLAMGVTHAVFAACVVATGQLKIGRCLSGYVLAMAIPASVYAWFYTRTGPGLWSDNLLMISNFSSNWFTLSRAGFANIAYFAEGALWSAHALAGCLAVMWVLARAEAFCERPPLPRGDSGGSERDTGAVCRRGHVGMSVLTLLGGALGASVYIRLGPFLALRILPILLLVMIISHVVRFVRASRAITISPPGGTHKSVFVRVCGIQHRQKSRRAGISATQWRMHPTASRDLAALLLYTFALAMLARILLRCGAEYYGFYLALPGVLVLAMFWCRIAPALCSPRKLRGSVAAQICGFLIMAGLVWTHVEQTSRMFREMYTGPGAVIRTPRGVLPCPIRYAGAVDRAVEYLSKLPPETKVVVIPEGAGITYLAGCTNALGLHTFLPVDFSGSYTDEAMVKRFELTAPDLIIRTSRETQEYGKQGLGIDYGLKLQTWIETHYRETKVFQGDSYRVTILVREN